jgi:hypothetical protein
VKLPAVKLLESEPDAILRYCQAVRQAGPDKASYMLGPFKRLRYSQMDHDTIETVEDALYFGVFGVDRPHQRRSSEPRVNLRLR